MRRDARTIPDDPRRLIAVLQPDQLCQGMRRFARRPLSRAARVGLWALRGYVVVMLALVAVQVVELVH